VIIGLLAVDGEPSIVEKKLDQLEELIAYIAINELAEVWNTKLVKLWARYAGCSEIKDLLTNANQSTGTPHPLTEISKVAPQGEIFLFYLKSLTFIFTFSFLI